MPPLWRAPGCDGPLASNSHPATPSPRLPSLLRLLQWRRQLEEYFSTPLGTITIILAIWALLATGWFYRLVNAFFFFFFGVMPFLIIPLSTYLQRKVGSRAGCCACRLPAGAAVLA